MGLLLWFGRHFYVVVVVLFCDSIIFIFGIFLNFLNGRIIIIGWCMMSSICNNKNTKNFSNVNTISIQ